MEPRLQRDRLAHRSLRPPSARHRTPALAALVAAVAGIGASEVWCAPGAPPARPRAQVEAVLAQTPRDDQGPAPRPLHVVLVADTKDHGPGQHDYPHFQRTWAELLRRSPGGASAASGTKPTAVTTSLAWQWPSPEQWAKADVAVAVCYLNWSESRFRELEAFLSRGGGFVMVHAATWTKPDPSPQLAGITGVGGFTRWREGPLELEVNIEHPICRGFPRRFLLEDEAYWPPTPAPAPGSIEILVTSHETTDAAGPARAQPQVWTHRHGKGRVFGCVPGHHTWTLEDPLFRLLLLRGIAWSAGESPHRFDSLALTEARPAP